MRSLVPLALLGFVAVSSAQNMAFAFERTIAVDGRWATLVEALPNGNFAVAMHGNVGPSTLYVVSRTNQVLAATNLVAYPGEQFDLRDLKVDAAGNIYLAGGSRDVLQNSYFYKFTQAGALVWKRGLDLGGNGLNDLTSKIVVGNDGSIYALGQYYGPSIQQSGIAKMDTNGALLWRRRFDTLSTYPNDLQMTPDGTRVVAQMTYFPSPDSLAVVNASTGAVAYHRQITESVSGQTLAVDNGAAYVGSYVERIIPSSSQRDANPAVFKYALATGAHLQTAEFGNEDYFEFANGNLVRQILRDPSGNLTIHYEVSDEFYEATVVQRLTPALTSLGATAVEKGSASFAFANDLALDPFNGSLGLIFRSYSGSDRRYGLNRSNVGMTQLFTGEAPTAPNTTFYSLRSLAMTPGGDVLVVGSKADQRYWACYRLAPQAINDFRTTPRNTPLNGVSVMINDRFAAGVTARISAQPSHGTVTMNGATGTFLYTPTTGYTGTDSFAYRLSKPGTSNSYAMVNINVTP